MQRTLLLARTLVLAGLASPSSRAVLHAARSAERAARDLFSRADVPRERGLGRARELRRPPRTARSPPLSNGRTLVFDGEHVDVYDALGGIAQRVYQRARSASVVPVVADEARGVAWVSESSQDALWQIDLAQGTFAQIATIHFAFAAARERGHAPRDRVSVRLLLRRGRDPARPRDARARDARARLGRERSDRVRLGRRIALRRRGERASAARRALGRALECRATRAGARAATDACGRDEGRERPRRGHSSLAYDVRSTGSSSRRRTRSAARRSSRSTRTASAWASSRRRRSTRRTSRASRFRRRSRRRAAGVPTARDAAHVARDGLGRVPRRSPPFARRSPSARGSTS